MRPRRNAVRISVSAPVCSNAAARLTAVRSRVGNHNDLWATQLLPVFATIAIAILLSLVFAVVLHIIWFR
jgi:hypothetical protein